MLRRVAVGVVCRRLAVRCTASAATTFLPPPSSKKDLPQEPKTLFGQTQKPVITLPVPVHQKAVRRQERLRKKDWEDAREGIRAGDPTRCVVRCRRSELNHYLGQTYSKYRALPLASEHWQSRRTNGDFFTFCAFKSNNFRGKNTANDFSGYELDARLVESLRSNGYRKPTHVQHEAIPTVLSGECTVIASETGNGKTLAYLAPALNQALALKESMPIEERKLNAPFVVIIVPSRELADQVFQAARNLAQPLGLSVRLQLGTSIKTKAIHGKREVVDVLVGSFGALRKMFQYNYLQRDHVKHIVLDEADTLLDDTFNADLMPFLSKFRGGNLLQLSLVGATFPTNLAPLLSDLMDPEEVTKIRTMHLHRVLSHVRQTFIRTPAVGKEEYVLDAIAEDVTKGKPVLIFCNKAVCSNFVAHFLEERGIACARLNSHVPVEVRQRELDDFLGGRVSVLSCTDLASRGLDTKNVHHVVNFDFPLNMADYIHRVGRVGRVGSPPNARVTSFVGGKIEVHLVQSLEKALRLNTEIPNVNNNIIRIIEHREEKKRSTEQVQPEEASDPIMQNDV